MRALIHALSRRLGFSPLGWLRNTECMRSAVPALVTAGAPVTGGIGIGAALTSGPDTAVPRSRTPSGYCLCCATNCMRPHSPLPQ